MDRYVMCFILISCISNSMEEKRKSVVFTKDNKLVRQSETPERRLSSPPIPRLLNLPSSMSTTRNNIHIGEPTDYGKTSSIRYEVICKNVKHIQDEVEGIRSDIARLKLELYDTSNDSKKGIRAYARRKKAHASSEEPDPIDSMVSDAGKRIEKIQDNLDLLRLLQ